MVVIATFNMSADVGLSNKCKCFFFSSIYATENKCHTWLEIHLRQMKAGMWKSVYHRRLKMERDGVKEFWALLRIELQCY